MFGVHTATVYRRALEDAPVDELAQRTDRFGQRQVEDRFGQPLGASQAVATFPCRISRPTGGETFEERSHDVAQDQRTLYTDVPDPDLREDDEVTVHDMRGRVLVAKAHVKLVKPVYDGTGSLHHIEVKLTTQRPSGGLVTDEAVSG